MERNYPRLPLRSAEYFHWLRNERETDLTPSRAEDSCWLWKEKQTNGSVVIMAGPYCTAVEIWDPQTRTIIGQQRHQNTRKWPGDIRYVYSGDLNQNLEMRMSDNIWAWLETLNEVPEDIWNAEEDWVTMQEDTEKAARELFMCDDEYEPIINPYMEYIYEPMVFWDEESGILADAVRDFDAAAERLTSEWLEMISFEDDVTHRVMLYRVRACELRIRHLLSEARGNAEHPWQLARRIRNRLIQHRLPGKSRLLVVRETASHEEMQEKCTVNKLKEILLKGGENYDPAGIVRITCGEHVVYARTGDEDDVPETRNRQCTVNKIQLGRAQLSARTGVLERLMSLAQESAVLLPPKPTADMTVLLREVIRHSWDLDAQSTAREYVQSWLMQWRLPGKSAQLLVPAADCVSETLRLVLRDVSEGGDKVLDTAAGLLRYHAYFHQHPPEDFQEAFKLAARIEKERGLVEIDYESQYGIWFRVWLPAAEAAHCVLCGDDLAVPISGSDWKRPVPFSQVRCIRGFSDYYTPLYKVPDPVCPF